MQIRQLTTTIPNPIQNQKPNPFFSEFEDSENTTGNNISNEIELYMNSKHGKVSDILKFWMKNKGFIQICGDILCRLLRFPHRRQQPNEYLAWRTI